MVRYVEAGIGKVYCGLFTLFVCVFTLKFAE